MPALVISIFCSEKLFNDIIQFQVYSIQSERLSIRVDFKCVAQANLDDQPKLGQEAFDELTASANAMIGVLKLSQSLSRDSEFIRNHPFIWRFKIRF